MKRSTGIRSPKIELEQQYSITFEMINKEVTSLDKQIASFERCIKAFDKDAPNHWEKQLKKIKDRKTSLLHEKNKIFKLY